jgi:predicted MFS family arabinose efflux permease
MDTRRRWIALIVLCLGEIMIVLDATIVNVALPSIREDLGFSQTSLAWVVNAYLLTFGGFLLLAGRLGVLFGHRKLFLTGIARRHSREQLLRPLPQAAQPARGESPEAIGSPITADAE